MGRFERVQNGGHLLDGECCRPRPACRDFEFRSDRLTFPHYFRRVAHQRRLDLITDSIQSDFCDAGVVECRSHHIEQPFDVAGGMLVFFDAPFGQLELPGWRPKGDGCINLAYAGEIVREQLDCPLGCIL
ncbi:hypothetical protein [Bradyrhizobium iriomotense]|uniref:hypothetical protein n=1 Tax=Bradyrhizobium iriomotense TaxID=441950 RepID=UPI0024E0AB3D|nr:hypothetical protein [Bradyrhizobium iriomotense]